MKRVWTSARCKPVPVMGALVLLGAVSACAAGPELLVEQAPTRASVQAQAFERFTLLDTASDTAALKAVSQSLRDKHGIRESRGDEQAWHLVATLSRRPVSVGSFSDVDAREGTWTETPRLVGARRGPGLHVLTVVATQADGSNPRVARVSVRGPLSETREDLLQLLADAAATALVEGD